MKSFVVQKQQIGSQNMIMVYTENMCAGTDETCAVLKTAKKFLFASQHSRTHFDNCKYTKKA